jgi:hypothetical protein
MNTATAHPSIDYPRRRDELQSRTIRLGRELPGTMGSFANLHKAATTSGDTQHQNQRAHRARYYRRHSLRILHCVPRSRLAGGGGHTSGDLGKVRGGRDDGRRACGNVCL